MNTNDFFFSFACKYMKLSPKYVKRGLKLWEVPKICGRIFHSARTRFIPQDSQL